MRHSLIAASGGEPPTRRLTDRFAQGVHSATAIGDLHELLESAAHVMGFRYFALLHHASLAHPRRRYVRTDNYPSDWVAEFVSRGFAANDPVHQASRSATSSFCWGELNNLVQLDRRQNLILERSRAYGLSDGMTVPINIPGEPGGSCSFAVAAREPMPHRHFACAEVVGRLAFDAARRILSFPQKKSRPHLSRREVQCLRLVAAGKTDSEIGCILGISSETARQYVKRARTAYDCITRSQLVTLALRDGWLTYEDAMDTRN